MSLTLFYGVPEGRSFGSIVALEWSGAKYHLCRVQMPEIVSGDDYKRINPIGETPTLMLPDGRTLSESMAILGHIAVKTVDKGLGFEPGSPDDDRLKQMLAFLNTSFFNAFSPLWYAFEHDLTDEAKAALRDYGTGKVLQAHAQLETLLGEQEWLIGSKRSLADAYFMGIARWNDFHKVVDRRQFPALNSLYQRMLDDPAVRFAHAIEHAGGQRRRFPWPYQPRRGARPDQQSGLTFDRCHCAGGDPAGIRCRDDLALHQPIVAQRLHHDRRGRRRPAARSCRSHHRSQCQL